MLSNTLPTARPMAVRASILRLWIDTLYAALRDAERRAADSTLRPVERRAGQALARHLAGQIELFQDELYQLSQVLDA